MDSGADKRSALEERGARFLHHGDLEELARKVRGVHAAERDLARRLRGGRRIEEDAERVGVQVAVVDHVEEHGHGLQVGQRGEAQALQRPTRCQRCSLACNTTCGVRPGGVACRPPARIVQPFDQTCTLFFGKVIDSRPSALLAHVLDAYGTEPGRPRGRTKRPSHDTPRKSVDAWKTSPKPWFCTVMAGLVPTDSVSDATVPTTCRSSARAQGRPGGWPGLAGAWSERAAWRSTRALWLRAVLCALETRQLQGRRPGGWPRAVLTVAAHACKAACTDVSLLLHDDDACVRCSWCPTCPVPYVIENGPNAVDPKLLSTCRARPELAVICAGRHVAGSAAAAMRMKQRLAGMTSLRMAMHWLNGAAGAGAGTASP